MYKDIILNKQEYIIILYSLLVKYGLDIKLIPKKNLTIDFYQRLISINPELIRFFSEEIIIDIYASLLLRYPKIFNYIPMEKRNTKLCLIAINFHHENSEFIPEEKKTEDFLEKIIDLYKGILSYYSCKIRYRSSYFDTIINNLTNNHPSDNIYIKALKKNLITLADIPKDRATFDIIKEALMANSRNAAFIKNNIPCSENNEDYSTKYLSKLNKLNIIIKVFGERNCFLDLNYENIITIDSNTIYYSSFNLQEDKDFYNNFKNKPYCWMSDSFDQAILHLFNGYREINGNRGRESYYSIIQPLISRFTLKSCRIINSNNRCNINIFDGILNPQFISCINFLLKNACEKIDEARYANIFEKENNCYILYILQELNKYLDESEMIFGYKNYYYQKETAILNFNNIINIDSLKISKIVKYKDTNFPLDKSEYKRLYTRISYTNNKREDPDKLKDYCSKKVRMVPYNEITINYENFDNIDTILTYKSNMDLNTYFKNKYLKYKNKYELLTLYINIYISSDRICLIL